MAINQNSGVTKTGNSSAERIKRLVREMQAETQAQTTPTVSAGNSSAERIKRLVREMQAGTQEQMQTTPSVSVKSSSGKAQRSTNMSTALSKAKAVKFTQTVEPEQETQQTAAEIAKAHKETVTQVEAAEQAHTQAVREQEFKNRTGYAAVLGQNKGTEAPSSTYAASAGLTKTENGDVKQRRAELNTLKDTMGEQAASYYFRENQEKTAQLKQDQQATALYQSLREIQADKEKIESLKLTPTYSPSVEAQNAKIRKELTEKYGVSDLNKLHEQLEKARDSGATELEQMGYNFMRLYGYEERITNAQKAQEEQEKTTQFADEHPVLASGASVVVSPLQGLEYAGLLGAAQGKSDTKDLETYTPLDTSKMAATSFVQTARGTVAQKIESSLEGSWGKVGSFAYQTGMSMADFLYTAALTGNFTGGIGGTGSQAAMKAAENFSLAIMGGSAAANTTMEAVERGLTNRQSLTLGAIAGMAEVVTEKVSIETLLDMTSLSKSRVGYILQNLLAEGSEEVASDLINLAADVLVSKNKSQWQLSINAYRAEGMTDKEAFWNAVKDQAVEMGVDFLGGAVSGGVMAGGSVAVNSVLTAQSNRRNGAELQGMGDDVVQATIQEGLDSERGTKSYKLARSLQEKLNRGQKLTSSEIGQLYQANVETIEAEQAARGELVGGRLTENPSKTEEFLIKSSGIEIGVDGLLRKGTKKAFASIHGTENGLVYDDYVSLYVTPAEAEGINTVAKMLGARVCFTESVDERIANAKIKGNEILIEKNNSNPVMFLLGHEVTHRVQDLAPTEYEAFQREVAPMLHNEAAETMKLYVKNGIDIDYERAMDEATADYAGQLMENGEVLEQFIERHRADRTLLERFRDAIRTLTKKITGKEKAQLQTAEGKLTAALEAASKQAQKITATESGDGKYSIQELADGKRYVQADRQVIFGNDPGSWSEQLEAYINGKIRQGENITLIGADGDELILTATSAGKLSDNHTSDGRTMSDQAFEQKVNAATHIDELAQVSRRGERMVQDHAGRHGKMAERGWNYRTAFFKDFDGKYYEVTISVAQSADGSMVYNIGKMQERSIPQISGSSVASNGALRGNASSEPSISTSAENVNTKYSLKKGQEQQATAESKAINSLTEQSAGTTINIESNTMKEAEVNGREGAIHTGIEAGGGEKLWKTADGRGGNSAGTIRGELSAFTGRRGELKPDFGAMPLRTWVQGCVIEPLQGSVSQTEQILAAKYGVPSFVISDEAWVKNKGDMPAFSVGGQIYMRETLPEEKRGMFATHELTHVMRQLAYQPYLDFIERTPTMLNLSDPLTSKLLEKTAEHIRTTVEDATSARLCDELNATIYGHYVSGKMEGLAKPLSRIFNDFDTYISELTAIHKQFAQENMRKRVAEIKQQERASKVITAKENFRNNLMARFSTEAGRRGEIGRLLDSVADQIVRDGTLTEAARQELFEQLYEAGEVTVPADEYDQAGRDAVRGKRIYVDEQTKHEFSDDWSDFRKRAFSAGVYLTNDTQAEGIDSLYKELNAQMPGQFRANEYDNRAILENIVQVAENGKGTKMSLAEHTAMVAEQEYIPLEALRADMERGFDYELRLFTDAAKQEIKLRSQRGQEQVERYQKRIKDTREWAYAQVDQARAEKKAGIQAANERADRTIEQFKAPRQEKIENIRSEVPQNERQAVDAYARLKRARQELDRVKEVNVLTETEENLLNGLLRGDFTFDELEPKWRNNLKLRRVYQAAEAYEVINKQLAQYKKAQKAKYLKLADEYLKTANDWTDKKVGILYSRETMERNIEDIVPDRALAQKIIAEYITPVHTQEANATRAKNQYRDRVRELNLSRRVAEGNKVSEAYAVQLLGEAQDNVRMLEKSTDLQAVRDGHTLEEWHGIIDNLHLENPHLNWKKVQSAITEFHNIYDELFRQINEVRVRNGYEPINYRQGYFPHFQASGGDGVLAQMGRALGIETNVQTLPTTINGLTHTFRPGITWFGHGLERQGYTTVYDAVEGFDQYIEGATSVIYQTDNIQKLRALAEEARYRTGDEGIKKQVDAVRADKTLDELDQSNRIKEIYKNGKFALGNFVVELEEYTNILAGKKSRADRNMEQALGRRMYSMVKAWESRVGANMIAGNLSSALTNFIPLTQAGAQTGEMNLLRGMWDTLKSYKEDDGFAAASSFLTNRRGSDPVVRTWAQKASATLGKPMEYIDTFTADSVVRARYYQNLQKGLSEAEALYEADSFAGRVMADRSKGSMPTLFNRSNPVTKAFTQFQLEVNNQFSEIFKDLPRGYRDKGKKALVAVLLKYFIGAFLFNELYELFVGRRAALDPIGILNDSVGDLTGYQLPNLFEAGADLVTGKGLDLKTEQVGIGEAGKNLAQNVLGELPFSSGLAMLGVDVDGGRIPAASAVPDLTAIWDAATTEGWSSEKRWKEVQDELNKLAYIIPPFGGNQVQKIWKSAKALAEGGSYTVDAEGNQRLQYPVYTDSAGETAVNAGKMLLFGKNSLSTAQDWVDSNYNTLSVKQTAAYQDMLEAGVSGRDAYELLGELGAVSKEDLTESEKNRKKREILRSSEVSEDGKAIAYYTLMASDKEKELLDRDDIEHIGATIETLLKIKDASELSGSEASNAKRTAIQEAELSDEEKKTIYRYMLGSKQDDGSYISSHEDDIIAFERAGLTFDDFLGAQNYSQITSVAKNYTKFMLAGLDSATADRVTQALAELRPETGKDSVSSAQQYRAVIDTVKGYQNQKTALEQIMSDSERAKFNAGLAGGLMPEHYVMAKEAIAKISDSGSVTQEEARKAIAGLSLTVEEKAVLWQIQNKGWKGTSNPFSKAVGKWVYNLLQYYANSATQAEAQTTSTDSAGNSPAERIKQLVREMQAQDQAQETPIASTGNGSAERIKQLVREMQAQDQAQVTPTASTGNGSAERIKRLVWQMQAEQNAN